MIRKAHKTDLLEIDALAEKAINNMIENGIDQWSLNYPRKAHFDKDLECESLYVYEEKGSILGVMALYEENDEPYRTIEWLRQKSTVIHRILVLPNVHKHGIATGLLEYAIEYTRLHGYESIKIDTHPANYRMRHFLKKHHFIELDYIAVMHRIGYERLIEHGRMNRIMVLGSSGTGKTTLSKMLSSKLNIPHLPLDTIYWLKDWSSLSKEDFAIKVRHYLKQHKRYIIEGNYTNSVTFMERLKHADTIIYLDFPKQKALKGIIEREAKYKHIFRSDMAEGCIEEIDQEFLKYVYWFDQKKYKILACIWQYKGQKNLLRFKDRESLMRWLETI